MDEGTYPSSLTPGSPLTGPTSGITYMNKVPSNPSPRTDGSCPNSDYFYTQLSSGSDYTLYYCIGSEVQGNAAGGYHVTPRETFAAGFSCGTNTVAYDGGPYDADGVTQVTGGYYRTVLIGTQCWLKDNLNVGTMIARTLNQTDNSIMEKHCYNNSIADCAIYGGFYQWPEALQYNNGITLTSGNPASGNIKGICPVGWHIPSDTEYSTLSTYLGGDSVSSGKMKETGLAHWTTPNTGANNTSGFTGLGAGYHNASGSFYYRGTYAYFTITLPNGATNVYSRRLFYGDAVLARESYGRAYGSSVRCLKD